MISYHACSRCDGTVLEHPVSNDDSPMCINCGWRRTDIPEDVRVQVAAHIGKVHVGEERYKRSTIGTGKPPLSGWDRRKLRKYGQGDPAASAF